MTRDMRFRFIGVVFYVFVLAGILMTERAWDSLLSCADGSGVATAQLVISAVGVGAVLLTSEAIGYLFGTVFLVIFELRGGWSRIWKPLLESDSAPDELKTLIRDMQANRAERKSKKIFRRLFLVSRREDPFLDDVFFSYVWQQAPKELVNWPLRRSLSFINNWSMVVALAFAWLISAVPILCFGLHQRLLIPLLLTAVLAWALIANAFQNKNELVQFIDVCFHRGDVKLPEQNKDPIKQEH